MRLKRCLKCGEMFQAYRLEQAYCEKCLAEARSTTIRERTCRLCEKQFPGGPRAWYCPECRPIRQKEAAAKQRRNGPERPLGSLDRCTVCGKEYIVKSGRQRYCPDCAAEAVREVDREASKQWNKENGFYEKRRLSPRNGVKICVICGKPVPAGTPSITCSEECDRLRLRLSGQNVRIRNGKRKTEPTISRLDRPAKEKEKE